MLALAGAAVASQAQSAPGGISLEATALYKERARGCRTLDMRDWSHPTREVLDHAKVELNKVELCNHDLYPIYTVRFNASPMLGVNDKYFNRLYAEMAAANGFHSFAFIDSGWELIITVDVTRKNGVSISYEEFDSPDAK